VPQQVRVIQHQRVGTPAHAATAASRRRRHRRALFPRDSLPNRRWPGASPRSIRMACRCRQAALLHRFGGDLSRGTLAASIVQ
jgi:hypothetical protein